MKIIKSIVKIALPLIAIFVMTSSTQTETCYPSLYYGWGSVVATIESSDSPAYVQIDGGQSGAPVYVMYNTASEGGYFYNCTIGYDGYLHCNGSRLAIYSDIVRIHIAENSYSSTWLWDYNLNWQ